MNCESVIKQLPLVLYGELSFDEEEEVQQHLHNCALCRTELENLQTLHLELDRREISLDSAVLTSCRRQLRIAIAEMEEAKTSGEGSLLASIRKSLSGVVSAWYWKPVAASALIVAGFILGRTVPPAEGTLEIARRSEAPVAARVRYLEPNKDSGKVQMVVEETSQRTLSGEMDDERIRGLLLTAAREAQDPGMRVESMELLKRDVSSNDVRRALIYALQNDPNPGVRLKALEGLRAAAADPETRHALSRVLLADDNPGIRTQAIDLLVQKKEPEMVGVLQELMQREQNGYVRMKCEKALREMKASVETF